jgi:uncharacterized protein involved in outer membrane biogenesis
MNPARAPTWHPATRAVFRFLGWSVLALLALAVFMLTLFDWNWVRPGIEHYLSQTSQRRVHFDDLQIRFSRTLAPTVRLRGVDIGNAPWAAQRPFARVGEVTFVFDTLRTLFDDQSVVSHLILIDGEVDLERQADGLRNWRLRNPEYRGPGKYKVLRLQAKNSRIRFVNREIGLDLEASSETVPAPREGAAGPPLPNRIRFAGKLAGAPFSGDLLTADELSLQGTGEFFPLRGSGSAGGIRLELDGRIADFFRIGALDARARASGASIQGLAPFVRAPLPASPPFRAEARLRISPVEYALEDFHGTLGESDLAGNAAVSRKAERRRWRAQLHSSVLRWADLRGLAGDAVAPAGPSGSIAPASGGLPTQRVLPRQPWPLARLRAEDADLSLEVAHLTLPAMPALQSLRARAELKNGALKLAPLDLGLAGGHVIGQISFDANAAAASASLRARQISLAALTAPYPSAAAGGALNAHLELHGTGDSAATLLGSASGGLEASVENGHISNLLDAKLGLNGGRLLWLKLTGDREIRLRCAALALDFSDGVGHSRSLLIDSEQTRVSGSAMLDLRQERFELLLVPQARQGRVFALGSAIRASGTFRQAGYEITKGEASPPVRATGEADCAPTGTSGAAAANVRPPRGMSRKLAVAP